MQTRRILSYLAIVGVVVVLCLAALTPLRASRVAELDAEADRIADLWKVEQDDDALRQQSNEFYDAARDLEAPITPPIALGIALLLSAVAVTAWPGAQTLDVSSSLDATTT